MVRTLIVLAALPLPEAAFAEDRAAAPLGEAAAVMQEACGTSPAERCVDALKHVCHGRLTLRCYYSRKDRLDAIRQVGFPNEEPHVIDE